MIHECDLADGKKRKVAVKMDVNHSVQKKREHDLFLITKDKKTAHDLYTLLASGKDLNVEKKRKRAIDKLMEKWSKQDPK